MIRFLIQILCAFIPSKSKKEALRLYAKSHNAVVRRVRKTAKSVGQHFYCSGKVTVNKNTVIGDYVRLNGLEIQGGGPVTFGNHVCAGTEVLIIAQNHNYDGGELIPYAPKDYVYKDILIGDFVWLGSRVVILPGANIGEGAIIQGGAVVHGHIPPYAIVGGNPAKVFKYRDIDHFEKLKKAGKVY